MTEQRDNMDPSEEHSDSNAASEKQLDAWIDDFLRPPEELAARIQERCHDLDREDEFLLTNEEVERLQKRRRRRQLRFHAVVRIAAALLLFCCVGIWISRQTALPTRNTATADTNDIVALSEPPEVEMLADAAPARLFAAPRRDVAMSPAPASILPESPATAIVTESAAADGFSLRDSLALAKAHAGRATGAQPLRSAGLAGAAGHASQHDHALPRVAEELSQTWMIPESVEDAEIENLLKALLPEESRTTLAVTAADDVTYVRFRTSDMTLQSIADQLYNDLRWRLLSPESPQPNRAERTPLNGHAVQCRLAFVREE